MHENVTDDSYRPRKAELIECADGSYVMAETREETLSIARKALATRCGDTINYTVVGVFYVDQLLGMVQRAHRTTVGILMPTDPANSDEPPHEETEALRE